MRCFSCNGQETPGSDACNCQSLLGLSPLEGPCACGQAPVTSKPGCMPTAGVWFEDGAGLECHGCRASSGGQWPARPAANGWQGFPPWGVLVAGGRFISRKRLGAVCLSRGQPDGLGCVDSLELATGQGNSRGLIPAGEERPRGRAWIDASLRSGSVLADGSQIGPMTNHILTLTPLTVAQPCLTLFFRFPSAVPCWSCCCFPVIAQRPRACCTAASWSTEGLSAGAGIEHMTGAADQNPAPGHQSADQANRGWESIKR